MAKIIINNVRDVSVDGRGIGSLVNAFQEAKDPVAIQKALESYEAKLHAETKVKDDELRAAQVELADLAQYAPARKEKLLADAVALKEHAEAQIEAIQKSE